MFSSIPSWQILTAYAQQLREARDLALWLKVPLDSLLVWVSSEGSGETARMRRLAWTFAARIGDKYQIGLTRPILLTSFHPYTSVLYKIENETLFRALKRGWEAQSLHAYIWLHVYRVYQSANYALSHILYHLKRVLFHYFFLKVQNAYIRHTSILVKEHN